MAFWNKNKEYILAYHKVTKFQVLERYTILLLPSQDLPNKRDFFFWSTVSDSIKLTVARKVIKSWIWVIISALLQNLIELKKAWIVNIWWSFNQYFHSDFY